MHSSVFITTSIPYVNANPHIGHAQEFVLADFLAREYRRRGERVILQTGTDDNASKNVIAARAAGRSVREHVDLLAGRFESLVEALEIQPDRYVRTSQEEHFACVQAFWKRLKPEDLERRTYRGLYCTGCEDFLEPSHEGLCPDHKTLPDVIEEENVFFRLSRYQDELLRRIESDELRIRPRHRRNEVLAFIRGGLRDLSLTRPAERSDGWGVPAPGLNDQIVYVWIDALCNYLTGAGFGANGDGIWVPETKKIHVIGKNIVKFHAIYWPALLLSAGLPLPDEILVHGFLTNEGVKISKSLGNGVDPLALLAEEGAAAVRHYLIDVLPVEDDADFSLVRLRKAHDENLANRLGNLLSRVRALRDRAKLEPVSFVLHQDAAVEDDALTAIHELRLREASHAQIWSAVDELNARLQIEKPWEWLATDSARAEAAIRSAENVLQKALAAFASYAPAKGAEGLAILAGPVEARPLFPRRDRGVSKSSPSAVD